MSDKQIAIKVDNVNKIFKLPHERRDSVKNAFVEIFKPKNRSYEEQHILKDISFEVEKGEFFGIVGRNGSGKSTLLKILGQIYRPNSGEVTIDGTLTPFIELGIGFSPELTGRENVYMNAAILGLSRKETDSLYDQIVDFAELHKFMDQKLKNYSSGMQVRLAFSIAIQAHNDILLIDEVLAVGDANFQRKCFKVFREIKNSGKTVVFVTHDMGAVQEYCDRALMISDGEIVAIGSPREVALNYELANIEGAQSNDSAKGLIRPKNPTIKIDEVTVRAKDTVKNEFSLEDDIFVDITFDVRKKVSAQFNLYFVRVDGVYVAGINTTKDLKGYNPDIGKHTITCKIDRRQLPKQDYRINVAIYTTDDVPELIDIMDVSYGSKVPKITIIEKSLEQDGEFYIKGSWKK